MHAATIDDRKRVRIPDAKPGQVVSVESNPDGSWTLIPLKAEAKQRFPKGSLVKYFTEDRDRKEKEISKAFVEGL